MNIMKKILLGKREMKKPILIATLGFPGSGKTYFSERLAKRKNFLHLNSDKVRLTLFKDPQYTVGEHLLLAKIMDLMAEEVLKASRSVIYDVNFNKRAHRLRLQKLAKRAGAKYVLVWLKTDIKKAESRILKRVKRKTKTNLYRPINLDILHKMRKELEEPVKDERYILIDGHSSFRKQLSQFHSKL